MLLHRFEGEVPDIAWSFRANSAVSEMLLFGQRMRHATERTPGHLKCTRIWMVCPFAKLLLLCWARVSKMCFPYTFQLLCCVRRRSGLERANKPKSSSWVVSPQFLTAFTLQKCIWQTLPLVHYSQIRTNKVLSLYLFWYKIRRILFYLIRFRPSNGMVSPAGKWQPSRVWYIIRPLTKAQYVSIAEKSFFLACPNSHQEYASPVHITVFFFFSNSLAGS